jgi:hypothetical protein
MRISASLASGLTSGEGADWAEGPDALLAVEDCFPPEYPGDELVSEAEGERRRPDELPESGALGEVEG